MWDGFIFGSVKNKEKISEKIARSRPIYYKSAKVIQNIDERIIPLINILNKWKKHKDSHYTGIATTFSCDSNDSADAYVNFHSSKRQAENLSDIINKFDDSIKWEIEFYSNSYRLHTIGKRNYNKIKISISKLAIYLKKNFKFLKDDSGWRVYKLPYDFSNYEITDANIKHYFDTYLINAMEYIASSDGKVSRNCFMELMSNEYGINEYENEKIRQVIKRLKKYKLITEKGGYLKIITKYVPERIFYLRRFPMISAVDQYYPNYQKGFQKR